jgi:hypothetical protein
MLLVSRKQLERASVRRSTEMGMGMVLLVVVGLSAVKFVAALVTKRWVAAGAFAILFSFFAAIAWVGFWVGVAYIETCGGGNPCGAPVPTWLRIGEYGSASAALVLFFGGIALIRYGRHQDVQTT